MTQNTLRKVRFYSARHWRIAAATFAAYVVVYELTALYIPAIVPLYPASAVALAGLFFGGLRIWPAVLLGSVLSLWRNELALPYLIALPIAECLQAAAGAYIMRRTSIDPLFRRYHDMFYFLMSIVLASAIVPLVRTLIDTALGSPVSPTSIGAHYTAMLASLLIVTPFILRWFTKPRFSRTPYEWAEVVFVFVLLIGLDAAIFIYRIPSVSGVSLVYLLPIPFFWIALRMRPRFVSLAVLITSLCGILSVLNHASAHGLVEDMFQMEAFLITFATIFFIVVSLEEDRRVNTNMMRSQVAMLENAMSRVTSESNAKNDFIAILAHELRNPLAPILSGIDLLRLKGNRDQEELETLGLMEDRMETVKRLLDDLLDISRITEGKISLKREVISLEEVVRRAILTTDHYIKERHQSLITKFPKREKYVHGDSVRLEQVFSNLLTNASKYSSSGDTIRLTMAPDGDKVLVSIADEGMGINPKELESIFTPFHQLEGSKKGLGIGLALVRSFVEMHEGTVVAKSEGRGTGSTFVVSLPLHHAAVRLVSKVEKREAASKQKAGLRILVVDDNDAAAAGIGRLLELRGCRVAYAYDGRQALEAAAAESPDVVLLDVGLPDMDGYSVAKEMRIDGYTGRLIALTGYSTDDARERGKEAGFDHYLVKPAGMADLRQVIPELG